MNPLHFTKTS